MTARIPFFIQLTAFALALSLAFSHKAASAVEEHLRGVLEKTVKPEACAQITDALKEVYYIVAKPEAQKMCADLFGKRVLLTGTVEQHPGDQEYFFSLAKAESLEPVAETGNPGPAPAPALPVAPPAAPFPSNPVPLAPPAGLPDPAPPTPPTPPKKNE